MHPIRLAPVYYESNGLIVKCFAIGGRAEYKEAHGTEVTLRVTVGKTVLMVVITTTNFPFKSQGERAVQIIRSTEIGPLNLNWVAIHIESYFFDKVRVIETST